MRIFWEDSGGGPKQARTQQRQDYVSVEAVVQDPNGGGDVVIKLQISANHKDGKITITATPDAGDEIVSSKNPNTKGIHQWWVRPKKKEQE